jgi:hypothetical protein
MSADEKDDAVREGNDSRRDEILRRMLATPPKPHKPLTGTKPKMRPAHKGRVNKGKTRS